MGEELFYIPGNIDVNIESIKNGMEEFYTRAKELLEGGDEMEKAAVVMKEAEAVYEKLQENFDRDKALALAYYVDRCSIELGLYNTFEPDLYMRAVNEEEYLIYKERWLKRGEERNIDE